MLVDVGDEKELREYEVNELKFRPRRRREKGGKGDRPEKGAAEQELKQLEAFEKKEGKSKLDGD